MNSTSINQSIFLEIFTTGENLPNGAQREITKISKQVYAAARRLFETLEKRQAQLGGKLRKYIVMPTTASLHWTLSHILKPLRNPATLGTKATKIRAIGRTVSTEIGDRSESRRSVYLRRRLSPEPFSFFSGRRPSSSHSCFLFLCSNLRGFRTQGKIQFVV